MHCRRMLTMHHHKLGGAVGPRSSTVGPGTGGPVVSGRRRIASRSLSESLLSSLPTVTCVHRASHMSPPALRWAHVRVLINHGVTAPCTITVFLGKCNTHAYGGWREICHATTYTDTMAPKFRKASSTRFAVRQLTSTLISGHFS